MNKIQQQIEQNEREFEELYGDSLLTYSFDSLEDDMPTTFRNRKVSKEIKSHLHSSQLSIIKAELLDLPEERIVHEYMEIQGDGKSKEYCNGWNDYRNAMITRLNELLDNK